ncbi:uncharacterized protein [Littorina saxatilis]|uniref:uncharacterized protein isoform X2 n=1 Tax=Littorina saxatilis TaxID=31220 RepID=UPI0038B52618
MIDPASVSINKMAEADSPETSTGSKEGSNKVGFGMRAAIKMIRVKFPKAKDINTDTLDSWLNSKEPAQNDIILMDCRDEGEYCVSHLQGAQRIDWENADPQHIIDSLPKDQSSTVVAYCSIGYRSAALVEKLQKHMAKSDKGPTQKCKVYNLEGSLFKWANEGRAMVNPSGAPTKVCHPYNTVWGKMLNKPLWSYGDPSKANSSPDCV